jgi:hypothetical protein
MTQWKRVGGWCEMAASLSQLSEESPWRWLLMSLLVY